MNPNVPREEDLLGYVLNVLDADERRWVEAYLASRPDAEQTLACLRRALLPLACDRDEPTPHPDLCFNTLKKVVAYRCRKPAPLVPVARDRPVFFSRWRRSEVFVAAAIAALVLLLLPPAILQAQFYRDLAACRENLSQFHRAFCAYADDHQQALPAPCSKGGPLNRAGAYAPMLRQAALWNDKMAVVCPANASRGAKAVPPPPVQEIVKLSGTPEFDGACRRMGGCYAYHLGYLNEAGEVCGLRLDMPGNTPLMADRPPRSIEHPDWRTRNSPNHRGLGQNVLYLGGHARFERCRAVGDDNDIYLNRRGQLAPGLDPRDAVLAPSETPVRMPD